MPRITPDLSSRDDARARPTIQKGELNPKPEHHVEMPDLGAMIQRLSAGPSRRGLGAPSVLALQRLVGNRAVVQMLGRGGEEDKAASRQIARKGVAGSGGELPWRDQIQSSFGSHDIGDVQAFTGDDAATAATAIGAKAYTAGDRIAFAETSPSLHTAAHEAAHVIQQRGSIHLDGGVGESGDRYEKHANDVADRVVRGESAAHLLDGAGGSGPQGGLPSVQRDDLDPGQLGFTFAVAQYQWGEFDSLVSDIAEKTNGAPILRKKMKTMSRTITKGREKMDVDEMSATDAARAQTDILAASIVYPNLQALSTGYHRALKQIESGGERKVVRVKNRITIPNLRDIMINVRLESGLVVELQFHLADTMEVKQGAPKETDMDPLGDLGSWKRYTGHDTYDYVRILDAFITDFESLPFSEAPPDKAKRHELVHTRSEVVRNGTKGPNDLDTNTIDQMLHQATLDERFKEERNKLRKGLADIQEEMMKDAWETAKSNTNFPRYYEETLASIEAFEAEDTGHDLEKMSSTFLSEEGSFSDRMIRDAWRYHSEEAQREMEASPKVTDRIERLKAYAEQLKTKHEEKKKAKTQNGFQSDYQKYSALERFINKLMPAAIKAAEEDAKAGAM